MQHPISSEMLGASLGPFSELMSPARYMGIYNNENCNLLQDMQGLDSAAWRYWAFREIQKEHPYVNLTCTMSLCRS